MTVCIGLDIGVRNLAYCVMAEPDVVIDFGLIDLGKGKSSMGQIAEALCEHLTRTPFPPQIDKIVIENQPTFKNPKMKMISSMVVMHFMANFESVKSDSIVFRDPPMKKIAKQSTYRERKKLSVALAEQKFVLSDTLRSFYDSLRKKDDITDSFHLVNEYILETECTRAPRD